GLVMSRPTTALWLPARSGRKASLAMWSKIWASTFSVPSSATPAVISSSDLPSIMTASSSRLPMSAMARSLLWLQLPRGSLADGGRPVGQRPEVLRRQLQPVAALRDGGQVDVDRHQPGPQPGGEHLEAAPGAGTGGDALPPHLPQQHAGGAREARPAGQRGQQGELEVAQFHGPAGAGDRAAAGIEQQRFGPPERPEADRGGGQGGGQGRDAGLEGADADA